MSTDKRLSNWGRWGADDDRGAVNLLTPARVLEALDGPEDGHVYALGAGVGKHAPISPGRNATWHVVTTVTDPGDPGRGRAEDVLVLHTHAHSHIDSLAHVWRDHLLYNGADPSAVSRTGTTHASIEHVGPLVAHALLLDVAAHRDLAEGNQITPTDIEWALAHTGRAPAPADVILVRTGWIQIHDEDRDRYPRGEPGLSSGAAELLAGLDIVALGMDNWGIEPFPSPAGVAPLFCHELFLRDMGVHLIEGLDLSAPAADGVREGLFVAAPLNVDRGLGSPLNPLLIT